jgi:GNAT superfamily N-acetyltransferase
MERFILVRTPEELSRWNGGAGVPPLDPADLIHHAPDAHWVLVGGHREALARCSLWWRGTASLPGHRLGVIGHYAAGAAPGARRLLQHACRELDLRRCTQAVGPMDGNTWRHYRLLTDRGREPAFFLEPDNPEDWPGHFLAVGFTPLANYSSAITSDLDRVDPRMNQVALRVAGQGIRIRPLDPDRPEDELRRIYSVARVSFQRNFLYTSITEAEFIAQYRPLLGWMRPELVLIAECCDRPVGFLFALPDWLQARRGQTVDTVILKTVAVLPDRTHAGLGSLLVARGHAIARTLGYSRVIHALMHEANGSRNISRHSTSTMRSYVLFAKRLRESP